MDQEQRKKSVDLLDYWRQIVRRRWVVFTFSGALLFFTAVFTFLKTPLYKSKATLLLEENSSKILSLDEAFWDQGKVVRDLRFLNTQLQLLRSKSLAEQVAKKLNLLARPEFGAGKKSKKGLVSGVKYVLTFQWLSSAKGQEDGLNLPLATNPYSDVVALLRDNLEIEMVRDTILVELSFTSPSPAMAAEIANAYAEEFIDFSIQKRYDTTQQASNFLTEQISNLRDDLAAKERELQRYGQEKDIVFLSENESTVVSSFADLYNAYNEARLERIDAEAEYRGLKDFEGDAVSPVISDPAIQELKTEFLRLQAEYREKSNQLLPDHPEMVRTRARLDSLNEEINKAADTAMARLRAAQNKEVSIKRTLDRQQEDMAKMKSNAILYNSIKSEAESKRKLLGSLLERQSETQISAQLRGFNASNVSIIDKAEVPKKPASPKKASNLIIALLLGLSGGVGLCFIFDYFDDSVKGPDDVEELAGLPSLGVVPYLPAEGLKHAGEYSSSARKTPFRGRARSGGERTLPDVKEIELVNHLNPNGLISEDYRTIRTSILLSHAGMPPKVILFTSAATQEGKTATLANVAVAFAQLQKRVLVIDADLRKARLHKIFGIKNGNGLSGYLAGKLPLNDVLQATFIENLWLVPSGPVPPNPAELLNSKKMRDVLEEVSPMFDFVLLDSPPILAVIDGIIMSMMADSVVVVVRGGHTRRKPLRSAVEELKRARAKIIGTVYNGADRNRDGSYYSRFYRYDNYGLYGKEEGQGLASQ
jgi:capsular exopolysaccharide synthesis family protein